MKVPVQTGEVLFAKEEKRLRYEYLKEKCLAMRTEGPSPCLHV